MKIKQLIEILKELDGDRLVILSRDAEGNSYSPMSDDVWQNSYKDREIGLEVLTAEKKKQGYSEEDLLEGEKAVVFYPIH